MYEFAYINNDKGDKVAVILPIDYYQKMKETVEEYEDILLYRQAKADKSDLVDFDSAFAEIESEQDGL